MAGSLSQHHPQRRDVQKDVRSPLTTPQGETLQKATGDPHAGGREIGPGAGLPLAQNEIPEWKLAIKPSSWRHCRSPSPTANRNTHFSQQFPPLSIAIVIRTEKSGQD